MYADFLKKEITVSDIVFKTGPRINASGRIQNGKEAVDLLTEKDFSVALEKAGQINQYNETRKDLDKSMTGGSKQHRCQSGRISRPPLYCALQRRMAQRSDRHRSFPSDGSVLPPCRGTDTGRMTWRQVPHVLFPASTYIKQSSIAATC